MKTNGSYLLSTVIVKKRRQKRAVVRGGLRGGSETRTENRQPDLKKRLLVTPAPSVPTEQFQSWLGQGIKFERCFEKLLIWFIHLQKLVGRIPTVPIVCPDGPTCLDYKVHSTYMPGHEAIILHVTPYYQPFFRAFMPSMGRHLRATLMAQKGPSEHGGRGYPLQNLAGIESNPSTKKSLGLQALPDFQAFLRPLQSHF